MNDDLIGRPAMALLAELKSGALTPLDLLDALERRIAIVDGAVNALPTRCFERARKAARDLMQKPVAERGRLCGLPVAIKDLTEVAGVRTTHGSPVYTDHIPAKSDHLVEHLEAAGGVIYAKSNTPEFGAGANTFNEVFGATRNPWDLTKSAAGSSGGSAAALATGMAWLAHGSDMGGSLRNPASFCGIVGLRPSPGRVPYGPSSDPWQSLSVEGPMARGVEDCALLLDALSAFDPRDPLSLAPSTSSFLGMARQRGKPLRVAYGGGLGITAVDAEISAICLGAAKRFENLGVIVEEAHPDFSGAHEAFQTLRAVSFATGLAPLLQTHRAKLKPEVIWNIEQGLALSGEEIARATRLRGELLARMQAFMETYDLLLTPATIVAPYPVEQRYVESCNGQKFETYIDWLAIAYAITLVSLPALSLPCGFTGSGLPVGLQMVGRARGEGALLGAALLLEEELGIRLEGACVLGLPKRD